MGPRSASVRLNLIGSRGGRVPGLLLPLVGSIPAACGILGILHDALPDSFLAPHRHLPLIFAALLSVWVGLSFCVRSGSSHPLRPEEIGYFARRLSCAVYLLLYMLVAVHEMTMLSLGRSMADSASGLQAYMAGGVAALALTHCLRVSWIRWIRTHDPHRAQGLISA